MLLSVPVGETLPEETIARQAKRKRPPCRQDEYAAMQARHGDADRNLVMNDGPYPLFNFRHLSRFFLLSKLPPQVSRPAVTGHHAVKHKSTATDAAGRGHVLRQGYHVATQHRRQRPTTNDRTPLDVEHESESHQFTFFTSRRCNCLPPHTATSMPPQRGCDPMSPYAAAADLAMSLVSA